MATKKQVDVEREAGRFAWVMFHFGKRLRYWCRTNPEDVIPPEPILDVAKAYTAGLGMLMKERREWYRLQLQAGAAKPLSDEEFKLLEAEHRGDLLDQMTVEELEQQLASKRK